jgi:hypothetical protein
MMKKKCILALFILSIVLLNCEDDYVSPYETSAVVSNELQFIVEYSSAWDGILETNDVTISISGNSNRTYSYNSPDFDGFCYISAQKNDDSNNGLTVKIRHIVKFEDSSDDYDDILKSATTNAQYGIASVNVTFDNH